MVIINLLWVCVDDKKCRLCSADKDFMGLVLMIKNV